jgi:hypothetical protein
LRLTGTLSSEKRAIANTKFLNVCYKWLTRRQGTGGQGDRSVARLNEIGITSSLSQIVRCLCKYNKSVSRLWLQFKKTLSLFRLDFTSSIYCLIPHFSGTTTYHYADAKTRGLFASVITQMRSDLRDGNLKLRFYRFQICLILNVIFPTQ